MSELLLTASATIAAPADTVFDVITDLPRYSEWNPWIREAAGDPAVGSTVRVKAKLGAKLTAVDHRVLASERGRHFRWCDVGWFTKIAYGERARFLEPLPGGGISYRVELRVTGIGWRLVKALYGAAMAEGLAEETRALKARAETLA